MVFGDKDKFAPIENEVGLRCLNGVTGPQVRVSMIEPTQNEYIPASICI